MQDKISIVLATFSNDWKKKLSLYIESPYFQVSESVQKMLTYYLIEWQTHLKKGFGDNAIHGYIFPNIDFDQDKIHRLKSESLEVAKKFIIQQEINNQSIYHTNLLLEYYLKNKLHNLFVFTYKQAVQKYENSPINIGTTLDDDYSIKQTYSAFLSIQNITKNSKTINQHKETLIELSYKLDIIYYAQKLEQTAEMLSTANLKIVNDIKNNINETLKVLDNNIYIREHPLVKIYYCVCQLKLFPKKGEYYDELILLLNGFKKTLQVVNIQTIYSHLLNYCTQQYNLGNKDFEIKIFQLYNILLLEGVLYDHTGKLSIDLYKNILNVALRLSEWNWAKIFIDEQKNFLDDKYKISVTDYGLALFAFYQKDYSLAQKLLIRLESVNILFDVRAKVLLLQNYYEKGDDNWETNVDNFRIYLYRLKRSVTEQKIKAYKNFHLLILNLFKLDKSQQEELQKLQERITNTLPLVEKKWLLEKVQKKIDSGAKKE